MNNLSTDDLSCNFENKFFFDWEFVSGRFFTENETLTGANAAIIGHKIMKDLFKTPENAIGKQLKIKGRSYTIIGVQKEMNIFL